ncbi:MAG: HNH endonuclease [Methanosarcinaceae archaeon]|nr:HNH endonuclease [Methanosarcinaceae archaeon]
MKESVFTDEENKIFNNKNKIMKTERDLINKTVIKESPYTNIEFMFEIRYTSPKGRNSYYKSKVFDEKHLRNSLIAIKEANHREILIKRERSKLSHSLRYDILKRDGFRCQICGKTANDGIKLEVDHIKPVSKGGKTKKGNLRALCNICNSGKTDKYSEHGIN